MACFGVAGQLVNGKKFCFYRGDEAFFFLYWEGVQPVNFLNAVLKADLEL